MKPHIFKRNGIWYCATYSTVGGMGYTPKEAFDDWKYWVRTQAKPLDWRRHDAHIPR